MIRVVDEHERLRARMLHGVAKATVTAEPGRGARKRDFDRTQVTRPSR